ncbi:hypothetical protein, partial [Blautia sp. MSJ-19]|uniref:hypothetical protein n=1 Tax=Blautia sp. MSJ-19 TaxID=2841517 RepID=UPI001C0EF937
IIMIITEIQHFSSKIVRFQADFKSTVEFICALEFTFSSQPTLTDLDNIHMDSSSLQLRN